MEITIRDENDLVRLYEAALSGCVATLYTLIQKDQLILSKVNHLTETPLHTSAMRGHLEFVRALLSEKPDLAAQLDFRKRSALHLASNEGYTQIVKALVGVNKDVCLVRDQDGRIPLHLAVMSGRVDVIQELINARRESARVVLDREETVLHLCVKYNQLEALKLLVQLLNDFDLLNSKNQDGNNILHMAVKHKQLETIKFLLLIPEVKARANTLNGNGLTAMDIIKRSPKDPQRLEILNFLKTQTSKLDKVVKLLRWMDNYNWLQDAQGTLLLVATVIATMAFQAAISPPGGVWQETLDMNKNNSCNYNNMLWGHYYMEKGIDNCYAGTPVLSYLYPDDYLDVMILNTLSFGGSLVVILLILSGFPLKNKICMWVLIIAMCTTVTFTALTFINIIYLVTPNFVVELGFGFGIFRKLFYTWVGFLVFGGVLHALRFCGWLVTKWFNKTS